MRQVAVRFTDPMVSFGDPRLPEPFSVKCEGEREKLAGRGRWADARNWVYDFEADLPAGQRCQFTLITGLKSAAGEALGGTRVFEFNTGGPALLRTLPAEGEETIDADQWFLLGFDAEVDTASLEQGAWCEADGINERIPLKLLSERETRQLIEANKGFAFNYYRAYIKGPRPIPIEQFKIEDKRWKTLPVLGVRCGRTLPDGAKAGLVIGPDVKSRTGLVRGAPQRLAFRVRPAFQVKFSCERANKDSACLPVTPMRLEFNAAVPREQAQRIRLQPQQGGAAIEPKLEQNVKTVEGIEFTGPFPEKTRYSVELPRGFVDDAGREPANRASFPLAVGTDENPPLAKFPGEFGILELNAEPTLPVTVRNIEATVSGKRAGPVAGDAKPIQGKSVRLADDETRIIERYQDFMSRDNRRYLTDSKGQPTYARVGELTALNAADDAVAFVLPRPDGGVPMEVIGIPFKKPGFYLVELASPKLGRALHGEEKPYYVATSVLVTNLAVHLKHGRERSIVWVTALDSGKPLGGVHVSVRDCSGHQYFEGDTDANGITDAADALPLQKHVPHCQNGGGLYALARLGDDVSFTNSSWNQGISPWNFNVRADTWRERPLVIHTVFDRTLFRPGETVSMKHIARVPNQNGFSLADGARLPDSAKIVHVGSGDKYSIETGFDDHGVATSSWRIPDEAKLGTYEITWPERASLIAHAEFRVEAYRVPLMRAVLAAPKAPQVRPRSTQVTAAVSYLAGGPAAYLPVKVRSRLEPRNVAFSDYPEFHFGGNAVKEGIQNGSVSDYWEGFDPDQEDEAATAGADEAGPVATRMLTLDGAGSAAITIDKLGAIDKPANLMVEMEYSDPNGEVLASATRVALHPAGIYLGIKPEGWAANKDSVSAQILAVDTSGKPMASRAVSVEVYSRIVYSHRRRLIGGFYAYDSTAETKRVGGNCSGTTDARGLMFCKLQSSASGELVLVTRGKDDAGNEAVASTSVWVIGGEEWWFEPTNHDRIDLVPEKKRYEPGETAKFQLRMPFREATVLVTVEREGVIDQKVVHLSGRSPVIEVPILGNYGPNVFVSALAVRGRIDPEVPGPYAGLKRWLYRVAKVFGLVDEVPIEHDTRPTALVDLTKPAYKMGLAEIKVGRSAYELKVRVVPDREVLHVRDTVNVAVEVTDSSGKPAADGEIALAAVDEGLLELQDNTSWKILDAMLGERPEEVTTSTAQGQVIGKRHFGRKALPPGGGGGKAGTRELFDTLLIWKARIPLDAKGRATVRIPLNDSLSSFRLVAIAQSGASKFGHGSATVRTSQDLMLFSGLPPLVRERDEFAGMFTLRNTTTQPLAAEFSWQVKDKPVEDKSGKRVAGGKQNLTLAAGEARVVSVPVQAPADVAKLYWEVSASAPGGKDRLRVTQNVIEVYPVRVYQATLAQLDKPMQFPVERPAESVPGRGGIRIDVMQSLGGELTPVYDFFRRYPYICYEQQVSRAIGMGGGSLWSSVAASLPNYLDPDGLVRYFPSDRLQGSDALTAYVVQIADASGNEWPEDGLKRMLDGLEGFATGRIVRGSALPTADLTVRKLAAIEALARHGRATPQMLDSITIDPALWPTSALIDWIGILQRVNGIKQRDEKLEKALGLLRARLNFLGTIMTFSTEREDALWWLMVSADVNANRALLAVLGNPQWREDVGRMVRGALSRQRQGTWGTTVANAWGVTAIARFSEAFEKTQATGTVNVSMGETSKSIPVTAEKQERDIAWPSGKQTLTVSHAGAGAPWTIVQSRAALPLKAPLSTGYAITRSVSLIEQKDKTAYSRGDVYRVTLDINAQTDMTWVVVDDPIPAGAAILGSGLGRDAASLTTGEKREGWAWPAFIERTYSAYRAYYEFVPKGHFKLEYTVRLNNPGKFALPSTRVEAMYSPELFGEVPNANIEVRP